MLYKKYDNKLLITNKLRLWGIWGKEQYCQNIKKRDSINNNEISNLKLMFNTSNYDRIKEALWYSYGMCNLAGFSTPIHINEFKYLLNLYTTSFNEYFSSVTKKYSVLRILLQELYIIKSIADLIPNFTKGETVNLGNQDNILRKYDYLDFFKFSLINKILRFDLNTIDQLNSIELATYLILSYFTGNGKFIENCSLLFSAIDFQTIKLLCNDILNKIEIFPEYPSIDFNSYGEDCLSLINFIENTRRYLLFFDFDAMQRKKSSILIKLCNKKYFDYINSKIIPFDNTSNNPLYRLKKIHREIEYEIEKNDVPKLLAEIRSIRNFLSKNYPNKVKYPFNHSDFYKNTNRFQFICRQYEMKILGKLFSSEIEDKVMSKCVNAIYSEVVPFLSYKKSNILFEDNISYKACLPNLIIAHHVHNANNNKLFEMMAINRCIYWSKEKLRLLISSSSSNIEKVIEERTNCINLGFSHYRIHARRHLKAGNQNRAIFNSIDFKKREYYLTLDDDYFVFPEFAKEAHKRIQRNTIEYYQSPLTLKGLYSDTVTNGERSDAESIYLFECSLGSQQSRIFNFSRGTGTIFHFKEGISSLSNTGGFYIDSSSEDFGQGFLNEFKKNPNFSEGEVSSYVWCIGEGVDLRGKFQQYIRWSRGFIENYIKILIPFFVLSLFSGEYKKLHLYKVLKLIFFSTSNIIGCFTLLLLLTFPLIQIALNHISNISYFYFLAKPSVKLFLLVWTIFVLVTYLGIFVLQMKKITLAPIRVIMLHNICVIAIIRGYIEGVLNYNNNAWYANKNRKLKIVDYINPILLIILNIIPFYINILYYKAIDYLSIYNIIILSSGLIYLSIEYRPSKRISELPNKLILKLSVILLSFLFIFTFYSIYFVYRYNNLVFFELMIMISIYFIYMPFIVINILTVLKKLKNRK